MPDVGFAQTSTREAQPEDRSVPSTWARFDSHRSAADAAIEDAKKIRAVGALRPVGAQYAAVSRAWLLTREVNAYRGDPAELSLACIWL